MDERYRNFDGLITDQELEKMQKTSVLIAGCGAGGPVALHLARMGFGSREGAKLVLADPDIVEDRNLGRPPYKHWDAHPKRPKVEALRDEVTTTNPEVNTVCIHEGVTEENIEELVRAADMVIEMVDISKPNITLAVHQECERQGKPVITGLDLGDNAILYVFDYRDSDALTFGGFLGFKEGITPEQMQEVHPLAIVSQLIIGRQQKVFLDNGRALQFYGPSYFNADDNLGEMFELLPNDADLKRMVSRILNGELTQIAQTDIGSQILGTLQARLVKDVALNRPVKTSPRPIRIYLGDLVTR